MKRTLILGAAFMAALFAACDTPGTPEPNPTEAYVPLAQGNEWDYAWDLPDDGDPMNWYVTGSEGDAWRVEFTWGDTAEEWLWRHTEDGEFQAKPADEENWRTYLKTPIERGTEWTFTDDDGVLWDCRIDQIDNFSDTPSGYYEDVVWVTVKDNDLIITNVFFKEGVGIVEVRIDDDGDRDANWWWLLNYYTLK
ncbi:MAG: hypothetical protein A2Y64_04060 [Candidatus Coatesbacteria bacterium RBG_13_66_14]|uniref:WW domain-containing protein n=1 Tax=Candidatus Coatesbacteria bacterium RBG_13_66_14 TaxID=1817816 RepID=A0A1F5F311_9BACT|nr:MAG: hypothetical protein A2Y64_04060 [Candidatus Coatesbacteria bacterium RBG_13_66_14]